MNSEHLPETDSIEELARFWDTHDATDFEDEMEEVTDPVFNLGETIVLRLTCGEVDAIRRLANSQGIAEAELIRAWVREKLQLI